MHRPDRPFLAAALCGIVAVEYPLMQTRTAADGPWAGWAQCELTAQFAGPGQTYFNQQTHTWTLTGSSPATSGTDVKVYPATWTVTGAGTALRNTGAGGMVSEQWITTGQPMSDTIAMRVLADGMLQISSDTQLRSVNATTGMRIATNGITPPQTIAYNVDAWAFPVIQSVGTIATVIGSIRLPNVSASIAPGQPPGTSSTGTCSWHFIRGGAMPPPLPPPGSLSQQIGLKPEPPAANNATSSVSLPVARPAGAVQTPPQPTPSGRAAGSSSPTATAIAPRGGTGGNAQPQSDLPGVKAGSAPAKVMYLFKTMQKDDRICVVQIGVRWDPVPDATSYTVYISDSADGAFQVASVGVVVPVWSTRRRIEFDAVTPGRASTLYVRIGASFNTTREGVSAARAITYGCSSSSSGWR